MITSESNLLDPDKTGCWFMEKWQQSCDPLQTEPWDSEQLQAMTTTTKRKSRGGKKSMCHDDIV